MNFQESEASRKNKTQNDARTSFDSAMVWNGKNVMKLRIKHDFELSLLTLKGDNSSKPSNSIYSLHS